MMFSAFIGEIQTVALLPHSRLVASNHALVGFLLQSKESVFRSNGDYKLLMESDWLSLRKNVLCDRLAPVQGAPCLMFHETNSWITL